MNWQLNIGIKLELSEDDIQSGDQSRFYRSTRSGVRLQTGFWPSGDNPSRDGVIKQVNYPMIHRGSISESISLLLSEHYSNQKPPRILLVPTELEEGVMHGCPIDGAQRWRYGSQKGKLSKLRALADRNAEIQLEGR